MSTKKRVSESKLSAKTAAFIPKTEGTKIDKKPPTISSEAGSLLSTVTPGMTVTMPRHQPAANNPASSSTHDLSQPPSGTSHG